MKTKTIKKKLKKSLKQQAKYIKLIAKYDNFYMLEIPVSKIRGWALRLEEWELNTIQLKAKLVMAQEAERLGKLKEAR